MNCSLCNFDRTTGVAVYDRNTHFAECPFFALDAGYYFCQTCWDKMATLAMEKAYARKGNEARKGIPDSGGGIR